MALALVPKTRRGHFLCAPQRAYMESELQTTPASEAASSGQTESTASAPAEAPAQTGGPNSWEAAFAADAAAGASNSDTAPATRATPESSATPAASSDAAPAADGAPAEDASGAPQPDGDKPGQREPQPGSRRSAAAELEAQREENARLREQFEAWAKERDDLRTQQAEREAAEAKAQADAQAAVEGFIGKPGELAQLLQKRAAAMRTGNYADFSQDDEDRLTRLTEGMTLYQPLLARARQDVEAALSPQVEEANAKADRLIQAWATQFDAASKLDLPGLDAAVLKKAEDIPALVRAAHAAGASSRDGEIADLQGQLTDAKARAFTSQPHLATGGVSGNGRTGRGYDPTRSPASNLESVFAEEAVAAPNGRR